MNDAVTVRGDTEVDRIIRPVVRRLAATAGSNLKSVLYSPLPFKMRHAWRYSEIPGQLVVVCSDSVPTLYDTVLATSQAGAPNLHIRWMRRREIRRLAFPTTDLVYQGASYWLRHRGRAIWGDDLRSLVPLPEDPRWLLDLALAMSVTWYRSHIFMGYMAAKRYTELARGTVDLARSIMGNALLLHGVWEVDEATVVARFRGLFDAGELGAEIAELIQAVTAGDEHSKTAGEARRLARDAVWLTERLVVFLRSDSV